jgi:hypothetical protein
MFNSEILDVAVGLVFIFLMLSLVVTALNELVAAWLKRRSNTLWRGVIRLVGDEQFAKTVYAHPLIACISQGASRKPSYIPSRTFVLALLDGLTKPGEPPPMTPAEVSAALPKLPPQLATSLNVLLHDAGNDMEEFKRILEQWFEGSMERVSGWYKRQTQWILLVMAAGITVWSNSDTIMFANTLWRDPALRASLVSQAQQFASEKQTQQSHAVTRPFVEGPVPPPAESPAEAPDYEDASDKFDASMKNLRGLGLPLGWADGTNPDDQREPVPALSGIPAVVMRHGLGWLLTTLAISLGAPFWFDILNKVVSIRAAGKAPEERQKAPKQVPTPAEPGGRPPLA